MGASFRKVLSQLAIGCAGGAVVAIVMGGGPVGAFSVPNNSVNSAKVVDNTIQSIDIKNGTITRLDVAPGQRIYPINHRSGDEVENALLASLNGITFRVNCGGGREEITVTKTSATGAEISAITGDASGAGAVPHTGANDNSFGPGEVFTPLIGAGDGSDLQHTITYSAADGGNVTAIIGTEDDLGADNCIVSGYAVG